jgi:DNA-3-methyladenine glycosylase II
MHHLVINDIQAQQAAEHLATHDRLLAPVIAQVGLCTIRPHKDYYHQLIRSIIGQQLSVKAAAAIQARFKTLFNGAFPTPEQILSVSIDDLRRVGFSRSKALYVQDLAAKILAGEIAFTHLDSLSNEAIIKELTAVKGIGVWTVHMFLIFCMGRLTVLPTGDLGIKNGIQKLYGLPQAPTPEQIADIAHANTWHPYESIASWYIWQSLNNAPEV